MSKVKTVEIKTVTEVKVGAADKVASQPSYETVWIKVENGVLAEIFFPKHQTHQVSVVWGKVVLVVWENNKPQEIPLDATSGEVVVIPSNVRYGFINFYPEPSIVVNVVLHHHGSGHNLEHHPVEEPWVYERVDLGTPLK